MKTIVVGAGPAGLSAAYELRKKGIDVTVFEASNTVGGRAQSVHKGGYIFDLGAQFAGPFYKTTFRLMDELGLGGEFQQFRFKTAMWRKGKLYPVTPMPGPGERLASLKEMVGFRGLSLKTMLQTAKVMPGIYMKYRKVDFDGWNLEGLLDFDNQTVADYVLGKKSGDALEYVFRPLTEYMTLGEPEEVGLPHFLTFMGFFLEGAYAPRHGMGIVPTSLYKACADSVKLSTPVKKIVIEKKKVKGVETKNGFVKADAVICAVTSNEARRLMPNLPDTIAGPLKKTTYSSTCHLIFGHEKRVLPEGWYNVIIPREAGFITTGPVDSSSKSPEHAPKGAGCVHALTYGRKAKELMSVPDEKLKKMMIDDLKRLVPDIPDKPKISVLARWQDAICLQPPGQMTAIMNMKKNNYRDVRGLYLAGEYMCLFSSVEGSLRSGIEAAGAAAADM